MLFTDDFNQNNSPGYHRNGVGYHSNGVRYYGNGVGYHSNGVRYHGNGVANSELATRNLPGLFVARINHLIQFLWKYLNGYIM